MGIIIKSKSGIKTSKSKKEELVENGTYKE